MRTKPFGRPRHILYILQAAWAVGVAAVVVQQEADLSAEYVVRWPGTPPTISGREARCGDDDARRWGDARTLGGRTVHVAFCFQARRAPSGELVIPYRAEPDGRWAGERRDGQHAVAYMKQVAEDFRIPLADERWFAVRWWPARWKQIQHAARWLLGGSAVLWAAAGVAWAIRRCIGAVGTQ